MASTDLGDSVGNNFDLTPDIETTIYFSYTAICSILLFEKITKPQACVAYYGILRDQFQCSFLEGNRVSLDSTPEIVIFFPRSCRNVSRSV